MTSPLQTPSETEEIEFLVSPDLPPADNDALAGSLPVDRRSVVAGIFGIVGLAVSGVSLKRAVGGSTGTPSVAGVRRAVEPAVADTMPTRIAAGSAEAAADAAGSATNAVGPALERIGPSSDVAAPAPAGGPTSAGTGKGPGSPTVPGSAPSPVAEPSGSAPTANPKPSPRSRPTADPVERPTPTAPSPPEDGTTPAPETTPEKTPAPEPQPEQADVAAETAVLKLTFGPTPGQIAEVRATGSVAFIEEQLGRSRPDPEIEEEILTIEPVHMTPKELSDAKIRNSWMRNYTGHSALYRASRSRHQLFEMMCLLWMDHFNVYLDGSDQYFVPDYQENAIRAHAMGTFRDLLMATAHAPAMLRYLNNDVSDASTPDTINENYGRELLELHTLGVDRHDRQVYTEQDVENASMVMGGWSAERDHRSGAYGTFRYRPEFEYQGPDLTLLNGAWSMAGKAGKARGDSLLEFLATHPSTANHIAYKICRRFVSDEPSEALVASTARVYLDNDTAIVPMLRHVFRSHEFAASDGRKARRPIELQAAIMRAIDARFSSVGEDLSYRRLALYFLSPSRNTPWAWEQPDGYPDDTDHWIVADALALRWKHTLQLAEGQVDGVATDLEALRSAAGGDTAGELVQGMAAELGMGRLPDPVVAANLAAIGFTPDQANGGFTGRRLGTLIGLLMAHPLFQVR